MKKSAYICDKTVKELLKSMRELKSDETDVIVLELYDDGSGTFYSEDANFSGDKHIVIFEFADIINVQYQNKPQLVED